MLALDSGGGAISPYIRVKQKVITLPYYRQEVITFELPSGAQSVEISWFPPDVDSQDFIVGTWSLKEVTDNDVSPYIKEIGNSNAVAFWENNLDLTPVVSSFDVKLPVSINVTPAEGDPFYILLNGNVKFSGNIKDVQTDDERRLYVCHVEKDFAALQGITLEYGTLSTQLENTTDPEKWLYPDDNVNTYDVGNYQILWVLQTMFKIAGLTLDVDSVKDVRVGEYLDSRNATTYELAARDFAVDQNMLYCFNQDNACNPQNVNTNFSDNKISFWDFIAITCAHLGFEIKTVGKRSYKIRHISERVFNTVSDSLKFGYKSTDYKRHYEQVVINWDWNIDRSKYYDDNINDLDTERDGVYSRADNRLSRNSQKRHTATKLIGSAKWYKNLQYQLRDKSSSTVGAVYYNSLGVDIETPVTLDYDRLLVEQYAYTEENITTDSEIDGDVIEYDLLKHTFRVKRFVI